MHRLISLRDVNDPANPSGTPTNTIQRIVASRPMQRLRRIRQLGFTGLEYAGSDHSRFAHSVGTMHVTRRILTESGIRDSDILKNLATQIGDGYPKSQESAMQHLLVAALLQDVGELPFGNATNEIFRPSPEVIQTVRQVAGQNVSEWPTKQIFTVAVLDHLRREKYLPEIMDHTLLAHLMTGKYWTGETSEELATAMQLLDGVVDADRIDYIARDALYTGTGRLEIDVIIQSIVRIDANGIVSTEPDAVAAMLALRAVLFANVYTSAENRLRIMALEEFLNALGEAPVKAFRNEVLDGYAHPDDLTLNLDQFFKFDDFAAETIVNNAGHSKYRHILNEQARVVVDLFTGQSTGFSSRWLRSDSPESDSIEPLEIPVGVFTEDFEYDPRHIGSVRVLTEDSTGDPIWLDSLNGPYARMLVDPKAYLPTRGDVLVLEPPGFEPPHDYRASLELGTLGTALKKSILRGKGSLEASTLNNIDYHGPSVFISYCVDDKPLAAAVVRELRRRQRKYHIIFNDYDGIGGSPGGNSIEAPTRTQSCIMLVTPNYVKRWTEQKEGNIAKELRSISRLRSQGTYPAIPLSTLGHEVIKDLPWPTLMIEADVFVGPPINPLSRESIRRAVEGALRSIDASDNQVNRAR